MTVIIRLSHVRKSRLCMKGARAWFAKYDLSWQEFIDKGVPAETLEATGDVFALQVCALAREEAANGLD